MSKTESTDDQGRGTDAGIAPAITPETTFGMVLQLVRAVQTGMQNIDRSHGLSGSQLWALWHISAQPKLKVSELAVAMHIHHSTASNLLDKLEKRKLVRRERQVKDNRVVCLHLTAQGMAVVKDVPGPLQGRFRRALQAVPQPVLDGLHTGVSAVLELMGPERGPERGQQAPNGTDTESAAEEMGTTKTAAGRES